MYIYNSDFVSSVCMCVSEVKLVMKCRSSCKKVSNTNKKLQGISRRHPIIAYNKNGYLFLHCEWQQSFHGLKSRAGRALVYIYFYKNKFTHVCACVSHAKLVLKCGASCLNSKRYQQNSKSR